MSSQKSDGEAPAQSKQAEGARKKKKVEEPEAQQTPTKDQGDERRKKKKNEEKKVGVHAKEKAAIKKTKVPKALKIHTSSESGGAPKLKTTQTQVKERLVEGDQNTTAKGDSDSVPKGDPLPQSESFVEAQNITNKGNQDQVQKNGDAPNAE